MLTAKKQGLTPLNYILINNKWLVAIGGSEVIPWRSIAQDFWHMALIGVYCGQFLQSLISHWLFSSIKV